MEKLNFLHKNFSEKCPIMDSWNIASAYSTADWPKTFFCSLLLKKNMAHAEDVFFLKYKASSFLHCNRKCEWKISSFTLCNLFHTPNFMHARRALTNKNEIVSLENWGWESICPVLASLFNIYLPCTARAQAAHFACIHVWNRVW